MLQSGTAYYKFSNSIAVMVGTGDRGFEFKMFRPV